MSNLRLLLVVGSGYLRVGYPLSEPSGILSRYPATPTPLQQQQLDFPHKLYQPSPLSVSQAILKPHIPKEQVQAFLPLTYS